jgi:hypothetical protein
MALNFTDFYILYPGHPRYNSSELLEDDLVRVIIQKYEMILFTNQSEVFGEPNMGCNLIELLYETGVSSEFVESLIRGQIGLYISELNTINYELEVTFEQDPVNFQDIMFITMRLKDYEVYAIIQ